MAYSLQLANKYVLIKCLVEPYQRKKKERNEGRKKGRVKLHLNTALELSSEVCYINWFCATKRVFATRPTTTTMASAKTTKTATKSSEEKPNRSRIFRKRIWPNLILATDRITCKGTHATGIFGGTSHPTQGDPPLVHLN